jgi:hypothetical protein
VGVIALALVILVGLGEIRSKAPMNAHTARTEATSVTIALTPHQMVDAAQGGATLIVSPAATTQPEFQPIAPPAVITAPAIVVPPVVAPPVAVVAPSVATLIAEVEAAGMEPGSNWTWTMGDTSTHCGVLTGAGTGCTYGADGLEYSIFAGSPTLALVAHELANAETQNDAVPSLLNEVAAAEDGTSWSPTDAVASCLVEHFMGFQDNSAGSWRCPAALATIVANNIHDTI